MGGEEAFFMRSRKSLKPRRTNAPEIVELKRHVLRYEWQSHGDNGSAIFGSVGGGSRENGARLQRFCSIEPENGRKEVLSAVYMSVRR